MKYNILTQYHLPERIIISHISFNKFSIFTQITWNLSIRVYLFYYTIKDGNIMSFSNKFIHNVRPYKSCASCY